MNDQDPRPARPRRPGRHQPVAALVLLCGLNVGLLAAPAPAAATTSTAPYAGSNSYQFCDPGTAECRALASADRRTGGLSVDLSVIGGETWEPAGCGQIYRFPPDPFCGSVPLVGTGAHGRAWLWTDLSVPKGVTAVVFTVTVRTEAATASGGSASAILSASAYQWDRCPSCSGSAQQTVVSSPLMRSAPATTRTLEFSYRSTTGPIPSGPISVFVDLTADARGPGLNEVRASGTVTAISASYLP